MGFVQVAQLGWDGAEIGESGETSQGRFFAEDAAEAWCFLEAWRRNWLVGIGYG
jgi:hypothetical protein